MRRGRRKMLITTEMLIAKKLADGEIARAKSGCL